MTATLHTRGNRALNKSLTYALLFILLLGSALKATAQGKSLQPATRRVKVSVPPDYPELARKMNIQGMARVLLTVAPEGKVTSVKELGGNPVLVAALVEA